MLQAAQARFHGVVDELATWSRGLNASEVMDLYLADALGTCGLVSGAPDCACGAGFVGDNLACTAE